MWGKEEESERGRNIKHSRKPSSFKVAGKEGGFWRLGVGPTITVCSCRCAHESCMPTYIHTCTLFHNLNKLIFPFLPPSDKTTLEFKFFILILIEFNAEIAIFIHNFNFSIITGLKK